MVEQIVAHKVGITLIMILAQTHVLVQIDGLDLREIQFAVFILLDQHLIGTDGAAAGGKAQNTVGLQRHNGSNDIAGLQADISVVLRADDFHNEVPLSKQ